MARINQFMEENFMKLRNSSLYIRFNSKGELTTPDQAIPIEQAALLTYFAGFTGVELSEYCDVDPVWTEYIRQNTEIFLAAYLKD